MEDFLKVSDINPISQNIHAVLDQENLCYIQSLKFLKNKEEMLQKYNPNF